MITENNQYVAAVDLGTTKVVMAVGRKAEKNRIEIVALKEIGSNGVMKGDLRNIEQASQALREVKSKLEAELGITINEAYIGVSGQHIQCNRTQGYVSVQNVSETGVSEVRASDVQRLIEDQRNASIPAGKTIISILPQSYRLDQEDDISEPVGMEGRRLEAKFNIIMGEEVAIERLGRCFDRVGLRLAGIVLQPLASAEAVLSDDEKELGVAVIDIGGGTTDLCIYYDKVIRHIAVIPIGGNIINKDIRAYGILERYVEKLKVSFGEAIAERTSNDKYINIPSVNGQAPKEIAVRTLAGIIEARMYDIIDYAKLEIERCGYKGKLGAGIVITGGGANLKNLDNLFKQHTGLEVRVASPTTHVTPESAEMVTHTKYSTLTGIMIDSLRQGKYSDIEIRPKSEEPTPSVQAPQFSAPNQENYNSYQQTNTYTVPSQAQQPTGTPAYPQENNPDEYDNQQWDYDNNDQYPDGEIHVRKPKVKERLKRLFGSMFAEDVDDEENNY